MSRLPDELDPAKGRVVPVEFQGALQEPGRSPGLALMAIVPVGDRGGPVAFLGKREVVGDGCRGTVDARLGLQLLRATKVAVRELST